MGFKFKLTGLDRIKKRTGYFLPPITPEEGTEIGNAIVEKMKGLIKRGISPIEGAGKFPPYKRVGKNPLKGGKKAKRTGYPYNAQKKYPSKRITPVNLYLSGDFLSNLKAKAFGKSPTKLSVEVGYQDQLSQKKEQGHAEGVNGQPKRPTLPSNGEQFAATIQSFILKEFRTRIRKRILAD